MKKILVTGATGQLGKNVINLLLNKVDKNQISALVRTPLKAEDFISKGIDVREGNYDNYESLLKAFQGIEKLYFVSGSDISKRISQHENVISAAKNADIKHIVYTSFVRKNETDTSPISMVANSHIQTEKWLKESGINYTILKHNLYMDMLPIFMGDKVLETKTIYLPSGDGKAAFALRNDMAKVGAIVLTLEGHENKEYLVSAEKNYSYQDVADMLSEITGTKINYVSPTKEEFFKTLSDFGVPEDSIGIAAAFSEAIKQGEFEETSNVFEILLSGKATSLKDYLRSVYLK